MLPSSKKGESSEVTDICGASNLELVKQEKEIRAGFAVATHPAEATATAQGTCSAKEEALQLWVEDGTANLFQLQRVAPESKGSPERSGPGPSSASKGWLH